MEFALDHLTKSTGIYRCPDNIKNFKVRIRIREGSPTQNGRRSEATTYKVKEFSWQEKCFSKTQKEFYRDERNCFSDRENSYHRLVCEQPDESDDFLFSYVNEEGFCPENELVDDINYLENALNSMNFDSVVEENEYNFATSLQNSIENPLIKNHLECMHIIADFGEYFEDTWIKNEKLLCTLKYNQDTRVLQVFPDFTTTHPYVLKIQNDDEEIVFSYFIENCSNNISEVIEANEKTLIKKIQDYQSSIKSQLITDTFKLPPKNKLYVFLFLEIVSGKRFEYPEVYVQYSIQLPDGWVCEEPNVLRGRTHICRAAQHEGLVHFGHCLEALLEYNFMNLKNAKEFPKCPYIYFEVISKDSWDRYRTEGVCYINLPISQSGTLKYNLKCYRFTTRSPLGEMKRFFIGDCQNYSDVGWIGIPNDPEETTLNKYGTETIGTGELNVRLSLIHQSQEFLEEREESVGRTRRIIFERLGSSTLIKSVEQVIREFKKARKEMLEARKNV